MDGKGEKRRGRGRGRGRGNVVVLFSVGFRTFGPFCIFYGCFLRILGGCFLCCCLGFLGERGQCVDELRRWGIATTFALPAAFFVFSPAGFLPMVTRFEGCCRRMVNVRFWQMVSKPLVSILSELSPAAVYLSLLGLT